MGRCTCLEESIAKDEAFQNRSYNPKDQCVDVHIQANPIFERSFDFILKFKANSKFAIVVPSRRFDGTNALVRNPTNLMETHYDEDSYKIHMNTAKEVTRDVSLVFVKRIMWDVDNIEDLNFLLNQPEKPDIAQKIKTVIESKG